MMELANTYTHMSWAIQLLNCGASNRYIELTCYGPAGRFHGRTGDTWHEHARCPA